MIKISAESSEIFSRIEEKLKSLPEEVSLQIENAEESLIGIDCTLRIAYGEANTIHLPSPIGQLRIGDDEDDAVCGDFRFIIPKQGNPKIHYVSVSGSTK